jgi:hypothetical protein
VENVEEDRRAERQERLDTVYRIERMVLQQWVDMVEKVVL